MHAERLKEEMMRLTIWHNCFPLLSRRCHNPFSVRMVVYSACWCVLVTCYSEGDRASPRAPHLWLCAAGLSFSPPLLRFLRSSLTPFRVWEIKAATAYLKCLTCSEPWQSTGLEIMFSIQSLWITPQIWALVLISCVVIDRGAEMGMQQVWNSRRKLLF